MAANSSTTCQKLCASRRSQPKRTRGDDEDTHEHPGLLALIDPAIELGDEKEKEKKSRATTTSALSGGGKRRKADLASEPLQEVKLRVDLERSQQTKTEVSASRFACRC